MNSHSKCKPPDTGSRAALIGLTLLGVSFAGGCEDLSPADEAAIVLITSLPMVILSWPVVVGLSLIGRRVNLVRNRAVLLQYALFIAIQVIILMASTADDSIFQVHLHIFAVLFTTPYVLLATALLVLVLPARLLAWLPSFLLVPHYLMLAFQYVTNSQATQSLHPFILVYLFSTRLWYLAVPVAIALLVGLLIKRKRCRPAGAAAPVAGDDR